jgi:putative aldouronate transport system substrate-binding protein
LKEGVIMMILKNLKFKAITTVVLISVLLVSLVACVPATPTPTVQPTAPASDDGPLTPYKETVTVSRPGIQNSNTTYIEGESIDDNLITRFYKEKLNIVYTSKWTVEGVKATEKLGLAIASNDLPDTFDVNADQLGRLLNNGQIEDLTGAYENFVSPESRKIFDYQDKLGFLTGSVGGKIHALPLSSDFANNVTVMYIRTDWMTKYNLQAPKTLDDVIAIAKVFVENDAAGNGETIGINLDNGLGYFGVPTTLNLFANPLMAYPKIWVKDSSGRIVYGSVQPEMKSALLKMQEAYKAGLFDMEFAVKDSNKVTEMVIAGKVGIVAGLFWNPVWPFATIPDIGESIDFTPYPIPMNTEGKMITQNKPFAYTWQVVRKGFKNPEAIVKSMNLWIEITHGQYSGWYEEQKKTDKYKDVVAGIHMYALPTFYAYPEKNLDTAKDFVAAQKANDRNLMKTEEGKTNWDQIQAGGGTAWGLRKLFEEVEYLVLQQYTFKFSEFVGAPTYTLLTRKAALDKLEDETFVKIIMGQPIDTFDEFVKQWGDQGGMEATEEVNQWYESK